MKKTGRPRFKPLKGTPVPLGKPGPEMEKLIKGQTSRKKKGMSFEDSLKKYGNDVTKIPGWSSRNPDGKVKPKKKVKKK